MRAHRGGRLRLGVEALRGPQDCVGRMREEYGLRRRLVVEALRDLPGGVPAPEGGFFAIVDVRAFGAPSNEIRRRLRQSDPGAGLLARRPDDLATPDALERMKQEAARPGAQDDQVVAKLENGPRSCGGYRAKIANRR